MNFKAHISYHKGDDIINSNRPTTDVVNFTADRFVDLLPKILEKFNKKDLDENAHISSIDVETSEGLIRIFENPLSRDGGYLSDYINKVKIIEYSNNDNISDMVKRIEDECDKIGIDVQNFIKILDSKTKDS